jgi:hypothetical protein
MTCPVQQRLCLYFPSHCTGARFLHRFINADATVRAERLGVGKRFVLLFYAYAYIHTICTSCMYVYIHAYASTVLHGLEACSRGKCSSDAYIQLMLRRHNVASVYVLRKVGWWGVHHIFMTDVRLCRTMTDVRMLYLWRA